MAEMDVMKMTIIVLIAISLPSAVKGNDLGLISDSEREGTFIAIRNRDTIVISFVISF